MSKNFDLDKGLQELEDIVDKMENGDLSIEESLKYFEKGIKLHRQCHNALSNVEKRISLLSEEDNYSEEKAFDENK